jgi:hypothetical protein
VRLGCRLETGESCTGSSWVGDNALTHPPWRSASPVNDEGAAGLRAFGRWRLAPHSLGRM